MTAYVRILQAGVYVCVCIMGIACGSVLEDKIYLAGRHGLAVFDPATQQWNKLPAKPGGGGFSSPAVAAHRGAVWVIGGSG